MKTKLNQSKLKLAIVSAMLLGTAGITVPAYAVTETADLAVSANIGNSCTISTTDLAFGAYDPIVTNKTASLNKMAAVSSTCTTGATGTIALNNGGNSTEEDGRRMKHASSDNFLNYSVSNAAYGGASWGDGVTVGFTGTGSPDAKDVYGSVAAAQSTAINGNYSDTIVATISY